MSITQQTTWGEYTSCFSKLPKMSGFDMLTCSHTYSICICMALTILCGSHILAGYNWSIMYNSSTLSVKQFFSHYIQQAWKKKKKKKKKIQNPDILGNLEIPARTCPGKRRHTYTLILRLNSLNTLHYLHWYSSVPCILKLHNLLIDCIFFLHFFCRSTILFN